MMQDKITLLYMRVLVQVVNPVRVEHRGPALNAMHLVALLQQKLSQVRSILSSNTGNQCLLFHELS